MYNKVWVRALALLTALVLLSSAALSLSACSSGKSPTALTIGDFKVSYDMLRYFVMNYKSEYESLAPGKIYEDADMQKQLVDNTNASLGELAAYYLLAKEYKLSLSAEQKAAVEDQISQLRSAYADDEDYEKALADNYATEEVLRDFFTIQAYCDLLYDRLTDDYLGIFRHDDATIMADVAEGHYFSDEYLVIHYGESDYEHRKQLAKDAVSRIKDGTLMSKVYTDYHSEINGTYFDAATLETVDEILYYKHDVFSKEQMLPYFVDIVTSLEVGEVSEPVEHDSSFVIVKRLELDVDNNFNAIIAAYLSRCFFDYVNDYADSLEFKRVGKYSDLEYWEIY